MRESSIFLSKTKWIENNVVKREFLTQSKLSAILHFPLACKVSLPHIAQEQGRRQADFACVSSNRCSWDGGGDRYWSTLWYFQIPAIENFWISLSGANTKEDEGISLLPGCNIVQNLLSLEDDWALIPGSSQIKGKRAFGGLPCYLNFASWEQARRILKRSNMS